jgi:hypothetical protein
MDGDRPYQVLVALGPPLLADTVARLVRRALHDLARVDSSGRTGGLPRRFDLAVVSELPLPGGTSADTIVLVADSCDPVSARSPGLVMVGATELDRLESLVKPSRGRPASCAVVTEPLP